MTETSTEPMLTCRGIEVAYDRVQVLFGIDLEIAEGEIVALLGTNGAGKSTLLKAISGLVSPTAGSVTFKGHDITKLDAEAKVKRGIVQMPGGRSVFPTLTVGENLRAATWLLRRQPAVAQEATTEALDRFPRLGERLNSLAGNLSGGEQQMLGLGMAFIAAPELLMIDELSLGLAPTIVSDLLEIVRAVHDNGTTLVLVEQSVNVALTIAKRAIFMEKGQIRFEGATSDLLGRDDILRSVFLQGANTSLRSAPSRDGAGSTADSGDDAILRVEDLTVAFGGLHAVEDTSFELRRGEVLGLIGPNGAGKTTIFDLISGYLTVDRGSISFEGHDITAWTPDRRAMAGLGRSFQDARIFPSMSVAENIALSLERHLEVRDHLAAALGLPDVQIEEEAIAWTVADLIELLGLGAFRSKLVGELSTGSRRIVDLAMAIAHDPAVLMLDEPSSGIAQRETEALGPLLLQLRAETGCSLLIIEHDMPLICAVSDRIVALETGQVIAMGTPDEVMSDPHVIAAYLGGDRDAVTRSSERPTPSRGKVATR